MRVGDVVPELYYFKQAPLLYIRSSKTGKRPDDAVGGPQGTREGTTCDAQVALVAVSNENTTRL